MKISKNIIKAFLILFLLVILANTITPFFGAWNFYIGGLLVLCIAVSAWLFLRKSNPTAAKYALLLTGGIVVAAILVFAVFFTISLLSNSTKTYLYDIGGEADKNNSYLYPLDRISNSTVQNSTNITYRNITSYLVYFKVPADYSAGQVNISFSLLDNLPYSSIVSIRGKNSANWSYIEQFAHISIGRGNSSSWRTVNVQFNASDLIIEDNQFIFAIDSPHLLDARTKRNYVSIDWINVSEGK